MTKRQAQQKKLFSRHRRYTRVSNKCNLRLKVPLSVPHTPGVTYVARVTRGRNYTTPARAALPISTPLTGWRWCVHVCVCVNCVTLRKLQ